jgi:hypothetical protein
MSIGLPKNVERNSLIKADDINGIVSYIRANAITKGFNPYNDDNPDSVSQGMVKDIYQDDTTSRWAFLIERLLVDNKSTGTRKLWECQVNDLDMMITPLIVPEGSTEGSILLTIEFDGNGLITANPQISIQDKADVDNQLVELATNIRASEGTAILRLVDYVINESSGDEEKAVELTQWYVGTIEFHVMELPAGFPIVYNTGTVEAPDWKVKMTSTNSVDMETGTSLDVSNAMTELSVEADDKIFLKQDVDGDATTGLVWEKLSTDPENEPWKEGIAGVYYYLYCEMKEGAMGLYPDIKRTGGVVWNGEGDYCDNQIGSTVEVYVDDKAIEGSEETEKTVKPFVFRGMSDLIASSYDPFWDSQWFYTEDDNIKLKVKRYSIDTLNDGLSSSGLSLIEQVIEPNLDNGKDFHLKTMIDADPQTTIGITLVWDALDTGIKPIVESVGYTGNIGVCGAVTEVVDGLILSHDTASLSCGGVSFSGDWLSLSGDAGDMIYHNGTDWTILTAPAAPAGNQIVILTHNGTTPSWQTKTVIELDYCDAGVVTTGDFIKV